MFLRRERLDTKTGDELRLMRRAGLVVADCLAAVRDELRDGVTTGELDRHAERFIRGHDAVPSFLGYDGFPRSLCISVNDEVVHGIPGERVVRAGDLVSIDCGAIVEGWHGDAAITAVVGGQDAARPQDLMLSAATHDAMWAGIGAFQPGLGVYEVGRVIEDFLIAREHELRMAPGSARDLRFGIVDGYTGHGIGREMHMEPTVYNQAVRSRGPRIRTGASIAIEPMVTLGSPATHELDDGWTVVTDDGARAAHWEHTVARTGEGLWVLTAPDGGEARLKAAGLPFGPLD